MVGVGSGVRLWSTSLVVVPRSEKNTRITCANPEHSLVRRQCESNSCVCKMQHGSRAPCSTKRCVRTPYRVWERYTQSCPPLLRLAKILLRYAKKYNLVRLCLSLLRDPHTCQSSQDEHRADWLRETIVYRVFSTFCDYIALAESADVNTSMTIRRVFVRIECAKLALLHPLCSNMTHHERYIRMCSCVGENVASSPLPVTQLHTQLSYVQPRMSRLVPRVPHNTVRSSPKQKAHPSTMLYLILANHHSRTACDLEVCPTRAVVIIRGVSDPLCSA